MKKHYQRPATKAVEVKLTLLADAGSLTNINSSGADFKYGGGGGGPARGRRGSSWEDEEE